MKIMECSSLRNSEVLLSPAQFVKLTGGLLSCSEVVQSGSEAVLVIVTLLRYSAHLQYI